MQNKAFSGNQKLREFITSRPVLLKKNARGCSSCGRKVTTYGNLDQIYRKE